MSRPRLWKLFQLSERSLSALSKAGYKVAHLDANTYYGADDASLSVDELVQWAQLRTGPLHATEPSTYAISHSNRYTDISYHGLLPPQSRQYAISLHPTVIPSVGPLIDSLIASGVSRYGGFKLLEQVALYDGPGRVKHVPGSKEDIFKDKSLSLLHKRRLMRFLMFAGGDFEGKPELSGCEDEPFPVFLKEKFSLEDQAVQAIAYALAFCVSASGTSFNYTPASLTNFLLKDPTLPALQRIRRYLRSSGRYGSSPFLVGHYGGVGEIAQGFCRTAAVGGATYILGHSISSLSTSPSGQAPKYTIKLCDIDDELRCEMLIGSQDYPDADAIAERAAVSQPPTERSTVPIARCIAILDRPLSFSPTQSSSEDATEGEHTSESLSNHQIDTAILVFPPAEPPLASSTAVHALVTGEASLSTPKGFCKCILEYATLCSLFNRGCLSNYAFAGQRRRVWECRTATSTLFGCYTHTGSDV